MKRLMGIFVTIFLLFFAGCADPFIYYRRDVSPYKYFADVAKCDHQTDRIIPLVSDGNILYRLHNYCLSEMGYTLTDPKTAIPWRRKEVEIKLGAKVKDYP